jgi:glutamine amidotransferase
MIHIVDYEAGNLTSVQRALDSMGIDSIITADADAIRSAARIIFPGVGHAGTSMQVLRARGLDQALIEAFAQGTPIMGICVGCQVCLSHSDEADTLCLDIIPGNCPRFELQDPGLKIPHMGWNQVRVIKPHPVLQDVAEQDEFYFVHSYYPAPADQRYVYAETEYETVFASAIGVDNLFATQFHPEKSGKPGLQMLRNFAAWDGRTC